MKEPKTRSQKSIPAGAGSDPTEELRRMLASALEANLKLVDANTRLVAALSDRMPVVAHTDPVRSATTDDERRKLNESIRKSSLSHMTSKLYEGELSKDRRP